MSKAYALPPTARDCWFLTGPTASGKTGLGIELARRLDAEIISMDSMALYRGMDIGTAKPTAEQRRAVPHHMLDIIEPDQDYSVAQYAATAAETIKEILGRGRAVLFVGGTPLYLKALLRGIFVGPSADWKLRRRLLDLSEVEGADALHARLQAVDPPSAERLHPRDSRRIIRALEVFEKTGEPISKFQAQFDHACPAEECRVFMLDWPREQLLAAIDGRVETMFAAGLVDEVRELLAQRPFSRTAGQAVGYREVIAHLQGEHDLLETIALVKTRTRQFAKRQLTWFRSLSECRPMTMTHASDPASTAQWMIEQGRELK